MLRYIMYISMVAALAGCCRRGPVLQTGDLLFMAGRQSGMNGAITAATGGKTGLNYTHVGIAVAARGADSVLEATDGGVRIVPLELFLDRAARVKGRPAVVAMRLRDTSGRSAAVRRARSCLGLPYDYSFRPENEKYYCSELVWESFRREDGSPRFKALPMNFRAEDGTMPRYWVDLFKKLGEPIPEGVPGTNPNDMARDPQLREIGRWF